MKVHRVVLRVDDDDDLGPDGVRSVLENQRYPNHCIRPQVVAINSADVDWTDDHPLNRERWQYAFDEMFEMDGDAPKGE